MTLGLVPPHDSIPCKKKFRSLAKVAEKFAAEIQAPRSFAVAQKTRPKKTNPGTSPPSRSDTYLVNYSVSTVLPML